MHAGAGEHTGQPSAAAGYEAGTLAEHDTEYDAALDASLAQLSPELLSSLLASPPATGDEPREPLGRQQQNARHSMQGSAQARTQQHEQQPPVAHQLYQPQQYHQQPAEPHRPQQRLQQQRRLLQQPRTAGPAVGTAAGPHSHLELHLPLPRHPGIIARPVAAEELPSLVLLVPPHPPSGHSQGALPDQAAEVIRYHLVYL